MTHHDSDHDHEVVTVSHFLEEYWPVILFMTFFMMTLFLPLMFLPKEAAGYFSGGIVVTLLAAVVILFAPTVLGNKQK